MSTIYWMVYLSETPEPSVSDVKSGIIGIQSGSLAAPAATGPIGDVDVTGLSEGTDYRLKFFWDNGVTNSEAVIQTVRTFTTPAPNPALYWSVYPAAQPDPSEGEILGRGVENSLSGVYELDELLTETSDILVEGLSPYQDYKVATGWSDGVSSDAGQVIISTPVKTLLEESSTYWGVIPTSQWDGIPYPNLSFELLTNTLPGGSTSTDQVEMVSGEVSGAAIAGLAPEEHRLISQWSDGFSFSEIAVSDPFMLGPTAIAIANLISNTSTELLALLQNNYLSLANLITISRLEHLNTERFKWVVYPSGQANPLAEEIKNQTVANGIYGEASVPELSGTINSGEFGNLDSGTLYRVAVIWTNGINYSNVLVSEEFQTLSSGIVIASILTRSLVESSELAQKFIASVASISSSTSVEIAEIVEKAVVGTVQKLALVSRIENTDLTSAGTINTENLTNQVTVDIITLVQKHLVSVLSVAQPSTLQNTALIQASALSAANLLSQNLIESTQVEEFLGVAVSGLFNPSSIESVEILQRNIVALSNLSNAQVLQEAALLERAILNPANSRQHSLLESVTQLIQHNVVNISKIINPVSLFSTAIATSGVLAPLALRSQTLLESPELIEKALLATVANLVNPNRLSNIELTQANTVVVTDLFNQSSLESVGNLRQAYSILFDSLTQGSLLESTFITESNYLNIENLSSPNLLEESVLTEINIIVPASLLSSLEITGVDLTQHHILSIDSISTAHLLAFLRLGGLAIGRLEGRLVLLSVFEGRLRIN